MTYQLFVGNNLEILPTLPDNSVDSIVTDPPYGLSDNKYVADTIARWIAGERDFVPDGKGFMGKAWDAFVPPPALWDECLRVLKPGGHLLAFFGSRTQDIGALAIRLAGFEIRDSIAWLYGSGFPKSMDISKAIDKAAGAEREVIGEKVSPDGIPYASRRVNGSGPSVGGNAFGEYGNGGNFETAPSTPEAKQWQGWGTALKPALEPIVVARKPIEGTVANNVLKWGTGGLNIDGSRIGTDKITTTNGKGFAGSFDGGTNDNGGNSHTGRWPANIILSHTELCNPTGQTLKNKTSAGKRTATFGTQDTQSGGDGSGGWSGYEYETEVYECVDGCPVKLLDEQSGTLKSGAMKSGTKAQDLQTNSMGAWTDRTLTTEFQASQGGASRFFYVAKASKRDRNEGLDELEETTAADMVDREPDSAGMNSPRAGAGRTSGSKNFHPTVKPTALMEYLVKLVTPPNGTVLDPFTGSGSTGKAAILQGFNFIGIEMTEEYVPIIEGRLKHAQAKVAEAKENIETQPQGLF
jgi:DNA modification methylase